MSSNVNRDTFKGYYDAICIANKDIVGYKNRIPSGKLT